MIQRLDFGGFILLRPEVLSRYAAAVVREIRQHPQELGCIGESELLAGELDYQDFTRLPAEDEAVVLRALLETFVSRAWCLRQPHGSTAILTFPSYFRRERTDQPSHPSVLVTYRFTGPIDEIYCHAGGAVCTIPRHLKVPSSGSSPPISNPVRQVSRLDVGCAKRRGRPGWMCTAIPKSKPTRGCFFFALCPQSPSRTGTKRGAPAALCLRQKGCARPFTDRELIDEALAPGGSGKVFCPKCTHERSSSHDLIEQKFESPEAKEQGAQTVAGGVRTRD